MERVLIIEDIQEINDILKYCLMKDGKECVQAFSGTEAQLQLQNQSFDLILLDLMLPGISGEKILLEVKEKYYTPVIVVSAKDKIETRVEVLELGADDFICKPFELDEVLARVHVQLRKSMKSVENTIKLNNLELNLLECQATLNEQIIALTKHEFLILKILMESPNQVFTKQNIYELAWEEEYLGDERIINTHIGNLRAKFRKYSDYEFIQTVWGIGFKFSSK